MTKQPSVGVSHSSITPSLPPSLPPYPQRDGRELPMRRHYTFINQRAQARALEPLAHHLLLRLSGASDSGVRSGGTLRLNVARSLLAVYLREGGREGGRGRRKMVEWIEEML